ncbi:MAG: hypothetical protein K2X29_12200 [Candidatus Obscuribacterales bacterium]|nr:hypothetical protein [Candidatus Obscuribacterales bacterium]
MEQDIPPSLTELKLTRKLLFDLLAEAKSLYSDDTSGLDERTVLAAIRGIEELIEERADGQVKYSPGEIIERDPPAALQHCLNVQAPESSCDRYPGPFAG